VYIPVHIYEGDKIQPHKGVSGYRLVNIEHMFTMTCLPALSFARTGKPAAKNVPEWPAYNLNDRATMRLDARCKVINDRFKEELAMWRSIMRV
jgi:carboxylesterase type B